MSLVKTLAKVAIGVAMAKGVSHLAKNGLPGSGAAKPAARGTVQAGQGGGFDDLVGQLGGMVGGSRSGAQTGQQGGGLGDLLGGMLGAAVAAGRVALAPCWRGWQAAPWAAVSHAAPAALPPLAGLRACWAQAASADCWAACWAERAAAVPAAAWGGWVACSIPC